MYLPAVGKVTILMLLRNLCVPPSVATHRALTFNGRLRLQQYKDVPESAES